MLKEMPTAGTEWEDLRQEMIDRGTGDAKWREGKTAVYVFNAGEDVAQVQKEAYTMYMSENGLGPLAFPSLKQMEDEVIGMGLSLLHAPEGAAGNITSGGTDSINMAVKAARDFALDARGISGQGNVVAPLFRSSRLRQGLQNDGAGAPPGTHSHRSAGRLRRNGSCL